MVEIVGHTRVADLVPLRRGGRAGVTWPRTLGAAATMTTKFNQSAPRCRLCCWVCDAPRRCARGVCPGGWPQRRITQLRTEPRKESLPLTNLPALEPGAD
jgi:hypothetical protein